MHCALPPLPGTSSPDRSSWLGLAIGVENLLLWELCSLTQRALTAQPNSSDLGLNYSCCRLWVVEVGNSGSHSLLQGMFMPSKRCRGSERLLTNHDSTNQIPVEIKSRLNSPPR